MNMRITWSDLLLCIFLILYGLLSITNLEIQFAAFILGGVAIVAGVVRFFGK